MIRSRRRLSIESLESRRLLAVSAADDSYTTQQNVPLYVGHEPAPLSELVAGDVLSVGSGVLQIEHSAAHGLLFLREYERDSGYAIRVIDLHRQSVIDTRLPNRYFTDMSLTALFRI